MASFNAASNVTCPIHEIALRANRSCGKQLSWDDGHIDRCKECYAFGRGEGPLPQKSN